jgi:hypothetical protein
MTPVDPLLDGITFRIGGQDYVAPPLTLGGIKAVLPRLGGNGAEVLSIVLCVSLKRNYPEITQPWLDEAMTGQEFRAARDHLPELLALSGMGPAEDSTKGEDAAAA